MPPLITILASVFLFVASLQQPTGKNVIEGQVIRADSESPVAISRARVVLTGPQPEYVGPSGPVYNELATTTTDDKGRFRLEGVAAGRYLLTSSAAGFVTAQYGQRAFNRPGLPITLPEGGLGAPVVFKLTPTATISGWVRDLDNEPMAGVNVRLSKIAFTADGQRTLSLANSVTTDDRGFYRLFWVTPDEYILSTALPVTISGGRLMPRNPNLPPDKTGYPTTYYPGVLDLGRTLPVKVRPGETLEGIGFQLRPAQSRSLSGTVTSARTGQPVRALIQLRPAEPSAGVTQAQTQTDDSGKYEIRNVAAGRYNVVAIMIPEEPMETGGAPVEVQAKDVSALGIVVRRAVLLRGRLVVDGGMPLPALGRTTVVLGAVPGGGAFFAGSTRSIAADGTFQVEELTPGTYNLQVSNLPLAYLVKSARFGSGEAWTAPITVAGETSDLLEVVISASAGSVQGTVVAANGSPFAPASVVLIPSPNLRTKAAYYKTATADQNGSFTLRGIAPGEYTLFAWDYMEGNAFYNPEFLRQYEMKGMPITVEATKEMAVRIPIIERED